jgi:hypothetical protein
VHILKGQKDFKSQTHRKTRTSKTQNKQKERNNENKGQNQCNSNKKSIRRINQTKSWFFEKINKIHKPLANLTKRREKTRISKIKNPKGEITTNTMEIQEIIRDYFVNLYSNKFENFEKMDRFLDIYDHPKLNQKDINHLNRHIT